MREQVIVLPPSVERRQASFSLSKKEEVLLDTSRNWAVSEGKNAEHLRSFALIERDHREIMHAELASAAENMKPQDAQEALAEPFRGACEEDVKQENACAEASLALEKMGKSPSPNGEDVPFLQWGPGKRSRCSRGHHHSRAAGNHSIKPNESSVLFRKTMRVQADEATAVQPNTSCHASKGTIKAKNGVAAEIRKDLWLADEKQNQKTKGGASDAKQCTTGSPSRGGKRGCPSLHKQDQQLLQQSKTCTLADPKLPPKDRCLIPLPGSNNASPSKHELVWPKLVIGLTRKEKEEDFLLLKGAKLPQRLKRRPKVVERALHFCTPGSWLVDVSPSRYDVMEKKSARKRPRGRKAMQSCDSDSD